jgi:hypothetical protein
VWFQRLKLESDEALSNFAFDFNVLRYIAGDQSGAQELVAGAYIRPLLSPM